MILGRSRADLVNATDEEFLEFLSEYKRGGQKDRIMAAADIFLAVGLDPRIVEERDIPDKDAIGGKVMRLWKRA